LIAAFSIFVDIIYWFLTPSGIFKTFLERYKFVFPGIYENENEDDDDDDLEDVKKIDNLDDLFNFSRIQKRIRKTSNRRRYR
jgi:hypothetical protein